MIMGVKLDVCRLVMTILSLMEALSFEQAEVVMEGQPHISLHFELLQSAGMFQSSHIAIGRTVAAASSGFGAPPSGPMVVKVPAGTYANGKWPNRPCKVSHFRGHNVIKQNAHYCLRCICVYIYVRARVCV